LKGAWIIAIIFLLLGMGMDYVFFVLIRNVKEDLYQPTTFYGYAFLVAWPIILAYLFGGKIKSRKKTATKRGVIRAIVSGLICLTALTLIIILGLEI